MHPSTSLLFSIFFSMSLFSAKPEDAANYGGDGGMIPSPTSTSCNNCTICQYPCHSEPPQPGYQPSATPPPPPPFTAVNCPPAAPVQCCGGQYLYPPAMPYYNQPPAVPYSNYPYNNYSGLAGPSMRPSDAATWRNAIFSCLVVLLIFKV